MSGDPRRKCPLETANIVIMANQSARPGSGTSRKENLFEFAVEIYKRIMPVSESAESKRVAQFPLPLRLGRALSANLLRPLRTMGEE